MKFLVTNSEHRAVKMALKFFDDLLRDAAQGAKFLGAKSFAMLHDRGTEAKDLLLEVLSIAVYQTRYRNEAAFVPFVFTCGILKCARRPSRKPGAPRFIPSKLKYHKPGFRERQAIEGMIRRTLTPFFENVIKHLEAAHNLRAAEAAGLSEEFPLLCTKCRARATRKRNRPDDMRTTKARAERGLGPQNPWGCKGRPGGPVKPKSQEVKDDEAEES